MTNLPYYYNATTFYGKLISRFTFGVKLDDYDEWHFPIPLPPTLDKHITERLQEYRAAYPRLLKDLTNTDNATASPAPSWKPRCRTSGLKGQWRHNRRCKNADKTRLRHSFFDGAADPELRGSSSNSETSAVDAEPFFLGHHLRIPSPIFTAACPSGKGAEATVTKFANCAEIARAVHWSCRPEFLLSAVAYFLERKVEVLEGKTVENVVRTWVKRPAPGRKKGLLLEDGQGRDGMRYYLEGVFGEEQLNQAVEKFLVSFLFCAECREEGLVVDQMRVDEETGMWVNWCGECES